MTNERRWLLLLLAAAFALRLIYSLAQDPLAPYRIDSGDTGWYLANGYALAAGLDRTAILVPGVPGAFVPIDLASLPTAPVYLLFIGNLRRLLLPHPEAAIIAIRVIQAALSALTCLFAYSLARRIAASPRAGWIAAVVLAVSPVFVVESAQIMTETVYLFFAAAGLWLSLRVLDAPPHSQRRRLLEIAGAGLCFGLATLTRAVLLAFPLGAALYLILLHRWRRGLQQAAVLLLVYALVVSTWTVYNLVRYNRLVIGAQGFSAFLYIGATGWQGYEQLDASLAEAAGVDPQSLTEPDEQNPLFQSAAASIIASDPLGWAARRARELAAAYLQPHGTVLFPGQSLRDLAVAWFRDDRTLGGLLALTQGESFWPKLAIYLFHYAGLVAGLAGMVLTRRRWRLTLPLIGFLVYTSLVHFVLDAIPRYLFPTEIVWWVFAAAALAHWSARLRLPLRSSRLYEASPAGDCG